MTVNFFHIEHITHLADFKDLDKSEIRPPPSIPTQGGYIWTYPPASLSHLSYLRYVFLVRSIMVEADSEGVSLLSVSSSTILSPKQKSLPLNIVSRASILQMINHSAPLCRVRSASVHNQRPVHQDPASKKNHPPPFPRKKKSSGGDVRVGEAEGVSTSRNLSVATKGAVTIMTLL